jgi:hypothetical protein
VSSGLLQLILPKTRLSAERLAIPKTASLCISELGLVKAYVKEFKVSLYSICFCCLKEPTRSVGALLMIGHNELTYIVNTHIMTQMDQIKTRQAEE